MPLHLLQVKKCNMYIYINFDFDFYEKNNKIPINSLHNL